MKDTFTASNNDDASSSVVKSGVNDMPLSPSEEIVDREDFIEYTLVPYQQFTRIRQELEERVEKEDNPNSPNETRELEDAPAH